MAICEYVEHPHYLKGSTTDGQNPNGKRNRGSDVPDKYFVIRNNEIVRIRYLLVYGRESPSDLSGQQQNAAGWLARNKSVVSIGCYAIFLGLIGIMNSDQGRYIRMMIMDKFWRFYDGLFGP